MLALCNGWMKHYIFSLVPLLLNIFTDLIESVYIKGFGGVFCLLWKKDIGVMLLHSDST